MCKMSVSRLKEYVAYKWSKYEFAKHLEEIIANHKKLFWVSSFFRSGKLQETVPEEFHNYLTILYLQAKQESMCFPNPSVNDKLLRAPRCLTLKTMTTQNSYDQNEDDLEVLCNPIRNFLQVESIVIGNKKCSLIISDRKYRPAVCI